MSTENPTEAGGHVTGDGQQWGPVRAANGHFLPGQGGRPRGVKNKTDKAALIRQLIEPHRAELIDKALAIVRHGTDDHAKIGALRVLLERLAPMPRHESERIEVPGMAEAATFSGKCEAIIAAVAAGEISSEAGERALRMLEVFRKAVVADSHEARLRELEARFGCKTIEGTALPAPDDYSDLI